MSFKIDRIDDILVKEISNIIALEVRNKDIGFVTITAAKVSQDLSYAKIYFTTLQDKIKTEKALNSARGFIRSQLMERVEMRNIPELKFIYDTTIEYSNRIEELIKKEHEKEGK